MLEPEVDGSSQWHGMSTQDADRLFIAFANASCCLERARWFVSNIIKFRPRKCPCVFKTGIEGSVLAGVATPCLCREVC